MKLKCKSKFRVKITPTGKIFEGLLLFVRYTCNISCIYLRHLIFLQQMVS